MRVTGSRTQGWSTPIPSFGLSCDLFPKLLPSWALRLSRGTLELRVPSVPSLHPLKSQHLIEASPELVLTYPPASSPAPPSSVPKLPKTTSSPPPPAPPSLFSPFSLPRRASLFPVSSPCTPGAAVGSRLLPRSALPSVTAQLAGALLACVFSFRRRLLPLSLSSPALSSAPPRALAPAASALPLARLVLSGSASLGPPARSQSLSGSYSSRHLPFFSFLPLPFFLHLPTAPLCLPRTFRLL